jgi:hypothetical protein
VLVLEEGKEHVGINETRDGLEYIKAFVKKNRHTNNLDTNCLKNEVKVFKLS